MTEHEAALWSLLHRVETHTATRYAAQAPALLTDEKRQAAARIAALVPAQDVLAGTELAVGRQHDRGRLEKAEAPQQEKKHSEGREEAAQVEQVVVEAA